MSENRITYCRTCGKTRMVEWLHRDCEPPTEPETTTHACPTCGDVHLIPRAALDRLAASDPGGGQ